MIKPGGSGEWGPIVRECPAEKWVVTRFQKKGVPVGPDALVTSAPANRPVREAYGLIAWTPSIKIPPMVDDPDIWRAANLLVKRHKADAPIVAARRADELLASGDIAGCEAWKRIVGAVRELARTRPAVGEPIN